MIQSYREFLASKRLRAQQVGFDVPADKISSRLFAWQRDVVRWSLRVGRVALFEDCGLGKSLQELEWARQVVAHTERPVLLLTPLAVTHQFISEAAKFGVPDVHIATSGCEISGPGIFVTNYEKLDKFDPGVFSGVVLDESSILKSFMGQTKRKLIEAFAGTPYRMAATATPAPNDHMELGNHAEFLGVMPSNEMLARWFINDTAEAGKYRLKHHAAADYWAWVASWAVCMRTPADIGHDATGYILPELEVHEHVLQVPPQPADGLLFGVDTLNATTLHIEKRQTAEARAAKVAALVAAEPSESWVIWCDTDYEADALLEVLPADGLVEVRGSNTERQKVERLSAFSAGKARIIVSKPSVAGFGLNWQHCARAAFVGLSYSYEAYYQALRRIYRFGQQRPVHIHVVNSDTEQAIARTVRAKEEEHRIMQDSMAQAMSAISQNEISGRRALIETPEPRAESGDSWTCWHGDCVEVMHKHVETGSVGLSVHSPPFANLYIYSDSEADMGNSADDREFFEHYLYAIRELLRVTTPGRLAVVHCKDLPLYRGRDGAAGLKDFPGEIIRAYEMARHDACPDAQWIYHSRVTIWKDPVTEMQRTKNHGLLHRQLCRDSAASRQGMADYLLVFRKWTPNADAPQPVTNDDALVRFDSYVGYAPPGALACWKISPDEPVELLTTSSGQVLSRREYSISVWQRYASPVWFDISQMNVLNGRVAREDGDEKHICPLQLDVIERAIHLWSNRNDLVLSPFTGIGSEGYVAVKMGRRFVGSELKESYHALACDHLREAERVANEATLFGQVAEVGGAA